MALGLGGHGQGGCLLFLAKSTVVQLPSNHSSANVPPSPPDKELAADPAQESGQDSSTQLINTPLGDELSAARTGSIAPISLAYIGDAVFELYVRSRLLIPAKRIRNYHQQVVAEVKAEQQAEYADVLIPYLSGAEKEILRRGRNATSGRHRRVGAKEYQKATGFEALVGFLYLNDQPRLLNLLNRLEI
ncbi:hypothetical protein BH23CYA1_BH23CYA1_18790 [soil metagenome]